MKLKHLAVAALLTAATAANAESLYLHIQTANGNWQVLDLEKVDRLTFTNGNMVATNTDNQTVATFAATDLATMQVNDDPETINEYPVAGIDAPESTGAEATFTFDPATRTIAVLVDGALTITAIDGRTAVAIPAVKAGQSVDVAAMAPGTYVINLGAQSLKAVIR